MVWLLLAAFCLFLVFLLKKNTKEPPIVHYGFIPYLSTLIKFQTAPRELLSYAKQKYGNIFTILVPGYSKITFVNSDEGVETFFKSKEDKLSLSDGVASLLDFLFEFSKQDPNVDWEQFRMQLFKDTITSTSCLERIHAMIEQEVVHHVQKWSQLEKVGLVDAICHLVVAINVRAFIGDEGIPYTDQIASMYKIIEEQGVSVSSIFLPFSSARKATVRARNEIINIITKVMEKRIESNKLHPDEKPKDILQTSIDAGQNAFQITSTLLGAFFAAHINTVSTSIWSILHTAQNSRVQSQLVDQLRALESLEIENLKKNDLLTCIIKETVRTHSLAQLVRSAKQNINIHGYTIPKGTLYSISPHVLHMNEQYFENPEEWNPDRYASGKNYGYHFIQWGFLAHRCLGEQYAYLVIRTLLAQLFAKYKVTLCDEDLPEPQSSKLGGMSPPNHEVFIKVKNLEC